MRVLRLTRTNSPDPQASQAGRLIEPLYNVSTEPQSDLFEIWRRIAADSVDLANRIEEEFHEVFPSLGRMPGRGTRAGN